MAIEHHVIKSFCLPKDPFNKQPWDEEFCPHPTHLPPLSILISSMDFQLP